MKRIILATIVGIYSLQVMQAHDFEVDGIYYNVITNTKNVEVTREGDFFDSTPSYSGSIIIKPTVSYNGTMYNVTKIGDRAFSHSSRLTSVTIPESVTEVGVDAFFDCQSLRTIALPNSIITIGNNAFMASGLTSIELPNSITTIGTGIFALCSSLKNVTFPQNVNSIPLQTFMYCSQLEFLQIPEGVEVIGDDAFSSCYELDSIIIPQSIETIGYNAFRYCWSLKKVEVQWENPAIVPVFEDIFEDVNLSLIDLVVPEGTEHLYAAADVWKNFGNITPVLNTIITSDNVTYANGILEIKNDIAERISIYSITGQLIWSTKKNASPQKYQIGNLSHGFYIIHGQSGWSLKINHY